MLPEFTGKSDYVLFSPIGMTDPARYSKEDGCYYDGPFLHILRQYRPKAALLFLTGEIVDFFEKDGGKESQKPGEYGDRYRQMAFKVSPETELHVELHRELREAHRFEVYDQPFRTALEFLHEEYPECRILANISSGTPQMEASLYLLAATLPFPIIPVQVDSPNANHPEHKVFPLEEAWKNLRDNIAAEKGIDSRCREPELKNVRRAILEESIRRLIERYDYSAAHALLKGNEDLFPAGLRSLLALAKKRISLEGKAAWNLASDMEEKGFLPLGTTEGLFELDPRTDEQAFTCYEYLLFLRVLLDTQRYTEFVRAISSILTELMELCCRRVYGRNPENWCSGEKPRKLSRELLQQRAPEVLQQLDNTYSREFRDSPLAAANLLIILKALDKSGKNCPDLLEGAGRLRNFEENVRNRAAHEMVCLNPSQIRQIGGCEPEQVLDDLFTLLGYCFLEQIELHWEGYRTINELLMKTLSE